MGIAPYKPDDVNIPDDLRPKDQNAPVKKTDGLMIPPEPPKKNPPVAPAAAGKPPAPEPQPTQVVGKPSNPAQIAQFRTDWLSMGFADMCIKYNVSLNELMQWAKEML